MREGTAKSAGGRHASVMICATCSEVKRRFPRAGASWRAAADLAVECPRFEGFLRRDFERRLRPSLAPQLHGVVIQPRLQSSGPRSLALHAVRLSSLSYLLVGYAMVSRVFQLIRRNVRCRCVIGHCHPVPLGRAGTGSGEERHGYPFCRRGRWGRSDAGRPRDGVDPGNA